MKTENEAIRDLLEEEGEYNSLVEQFRDDPRFLAEADWMYQDGVRVAEIRRILAEDERVEDGE